MSRNNTGEFIGEMTGKVKHTLKTKHHTFSYGFITPDDAALDDVFVHHKDIEPWREGFKELSAGDKVKFDLHRTTKGLQARNVTVKREEQTIESFNYGNREAGHAGQQR